MHCCARRMLQCSTTVGFRTFRRSGWSLPLLARWPCRCSIRRQTTQGQENYYSQLGISQNASPEEIKAAYKKMALQLHPDRNRAPDAEEKFKRVSEAYSVLSNTEKRQQYDSMRGLGFAPSGHSYAPDSARAWNPAGSSGQTRVVRMSKEDADRIFADIFGSGPLDQIFKDFSKGFQQMDRKMNRPVGGSFSDSTFSVFGASPLSSSFGSAPFGEPQQQQTTHERIVIDPHGNTYRVRETRTNYTQEDPEAGQSPAEHEEVPPREKLYSFVPENQWRGNGERTGFFRDRYFSPSRLLIAMLFVTFFGVALLTFAFRHPILTLCLLFLLTSIRRRPRL